MYTQGNDQGASARLNRELTCLIAQKLLSSLSYIKIKFFQAFAMHLVYGNLRLAQLCTDWFFFNQCFMCPADSCKAFEEATFKTNLIHVQMQYSLTFYGSPPSRAGGGSAIHVFLVIIYMWKKGVSVYQNKGEPLYPVVSLSGFNRYFRRNRSCNNRYWSNDGTVLENTAMIVVYYSDYVSDKNARYMFRVLGDAYRHTLLISRRFVYFPWDHIKWIKKELSDDGKDFWIPWDLLKPVSVKLKERYGKLYIRGFLKTGLAKISTCSTTWQFKIIKVIQRPIESLYLKPSSTLMAPRSIPTSPNLKWRKF